MDQEKEQMIDIDVIKTFEEHPKNTVPWQDCPHCEQSIERAGNRLDAEYFRCLKHSAYQSFRSLSLKTRPLSSDFSNIYYSISGREQLIYVISLSMERLNVWLLIKSQDERLVLEYRGRIFTFYPTQEDISKIIVLLLNSSVSDRWADVWDWGSHWRYLGEIAKKIISMR